MRRLRPGPAPTEQTRFTVGRPGDRYERAAELAADQALRTSVRFRPVDQPCASDVDGGGRLDPMSTRELAGSRAGGRSLPAGLRDDVESAYGVALDEVRIHTDDRADALNGVLGASAFTTGRDIFFRRGHYRPGSTSGRRLIAHELAHVVQQNGAPATIQCGLLGGAPLFTRFSRQAPPQQLVPTQRHAVDRTSRLGTPIDRKLIASYELVADSAGLWGLPRLDKLRDLLGINSTPLVTGGGLSAHDVKYRKSHNLVIDKAHVGCNLKLMSARLKRETHLPAVSSYYDRAAAERCTDENIGAHMSQISDWLTKTAKTRLVIKHDHGYKIGQVLERADPTAPTDVSGSLAVLDRVPGVNGKPDDFAVTTTYTIDPVLHNIMLWSP